MDIIFKKIIYYYNFHQPLWVNPAKMMDSTLLRLDNIGRKGIGSELNEANIKNLEENIN